MLKWCALYLMVDNSVRGGTEYLIALVNHTCDNLLIVLTSSSMVWSLKTSLVILKLILNSLRRWLFSWIYKISKGIPLKSNLIFEINHLYIWRLSSVMTLSMSTATFQTRKEICTKLILVFIYESNTIVISWNILKPEHLK